MSDAIDIRTEIQLSGVWTDITDDVRTETDLKITYGRADYAGEADPCRLVIVLNNRHGHYSPDNPYSPWYEVIGRNTPIRVSVPGSESYLSIDGTQSATASTPHVTALGITGDLDVRVEVSADWYAPRTQNLIGKWDPATGSRSWLLQLTGGLIVFRFSPDGVINFFSSRLLPALPRRAALRVTLDVNNGAGGWTAVLYWAPSLAGPWTAIGNPAVVAGTTSLYNATTVPLLIAPTSTTIVPNWLPVEGRVHQAEVRSGIDGTVVAAPDFRAVTPGASGFTDSPGRVWTVNSPAEVSNRSFCFHGEIAALPTEWDPSGNDHWVSITANGIKRRYQQGKALLASALRRSIVREPRVLAYWPMEEGEEATQAYSPVTGVAPMAVSNVSWAANSTLAASNSLPALASRNSGADLPTVKGRIPAPKTAITGWQARMLYFLDTENTVLYSLFNVQSTGTAARWIIQSKNNQSRILVQDVDGNALNDFTVGTGTDLYHQWVSVQLAVWQTGTDVSHQVTWQDVGGDAGSTSVHTFPGTIGRPTVWTSPPGGYAPALDGMAIGHIGVFGSETIDPVYNAAWTAYTGESAGTRMQRLAGEEGRPLALDAPPARSERVGPQRTDTWLTVIEEAAAADDGILYESRDALTMRYRDRQTLYGQPPALTLDYTSPGHVMPGIRPVGDDSATRNQITITRDGGSSSTSVQETGPLNIQTPGTDPGAVGEYDDAQTLSLHDDDQTQPIADWKRAHGTVPGNRFPTVTVNLRRAPELIPALQQLVPGDRADILNMPVGKGGPEPVRQIVQGWTHTLGPYRWETELNCSPAAPWQVAEWGEGTTAPSHWDTDGSDLAAPVTSSATTVLVRTLLGAPWTTSAGDLPLDIATGGERMRVSAVASASGGADTFTRTVSSSWGTSSSGLLWTQAGGLATDRAVNGSRGTVNLPANISSIRFQQLVDEAVGDCEVRVRMAVSAVATGASIVPGVLLRCTTISDFYRARLHFGTGGGMFVSVTRDTTQIGASPTLPYTYTAGSEWEFRVRLTGHTMRLRVWPVGGEEPPIWHHTETVVTGTIDAGTIGITASALAGMTNVNPQMTFDQFDVVAPQRFTVARAINTIVKAHTAGSAVTIADPDVWGL